MEEAENRVPSPLPEPGLAPGTARLTVLSHQLLGPNWQRGLGTKHRLRSGRRRTCRSPPTRLSKAKLDQGHSERNSLWDQ